MGLARATPSSFQVQLQVRVPGGGFPHGIYGASAHGRTAKVSVDNHPGGIYDPAGFPAGQGLQLAANRLCQVSGGRRGPTLANLLSGHIQLLPYQIDHQVTPVAGSDCDHRGDGQHGVHAR